MKLVIPAALLGIVIVGGARAGEMRDIHGQVIDESGMPVAGADVSFYWTANGPLNDRNGKPYDFGSVEGRKIFSANLGKMFPLGDVERPTRTGPDGRFSISIPGDRHHLLAMDRPRKRGGLAILAKGMGTNDVVIRLGPLVRVRGSIEGPGAGEHPAWATVLTMLPDDPTRPLDFTALILCGSIEDGRFEISLPPGRYVLNTYTMRGNGNEKTAEAIPYREILATGKTSEIDLGVLRLSPFKPTIPGRIERAKATGTWGDYTKHYGEKPPEWHILDARGLPKDAQISDFKGKWLLVYFWGLSCSPCLKHGIPNLIKFYEEHQPQRDRFEILSLCIDVEGELKSVADLDKRLESIVKHVWGKPQPFPVLLDSSFTTWQRFGLPGLGTAILIDPEGKLMKGDESVLAEKLKEPAARSR
jgi:hypothetical protein